ncbi:MAG: hypothetical protein JRD03_08490 [Deltaproteobacteria bacterium]|nr:hypothetical protein [Deltaproteobacteria bacterium]
MNKNGEKVNRMQLKENERCLIDFQREKLGSGPLAFNTCVLADRRDRVQRATERTATREAKKCDSLDELPLFAYTDAATVNAAATAGARALMHKILGGPPAIDADLFTKAGEKAAAACQLETLKRADKLENTVVKEINRAKKSALKDDAVSSAAALETDLAAVFLSNDRIGRVEDRLVQGVDRKCADLPITTGTLFPGSCGLGNPTLSQVEDCVIAAARCEACLKINAFDALNLNCDQADDHIPNASCE